MPCNVIVYEDDGGGTVVAVLDPVQMMSITGNAELEGVAREARGRLERVLASVEKSEA